MAHTPSKHYPPSLLDALWKDSHTNLEQIWTQTGTFPDNYWANLRAILRQPRSSIQHEIERRTAIVRRRAANNELEAEQHAGGVEQAVAAYMMATVKDKRVPAMQNLLHTTLGMPKRDVPKHRAQCVAEVFQRAKLVVR